MTLLLTGCAARDARIVPLERGWEYALTAPRATPPGDGAGWREDVDPRPELDLWYRLQLPANPPPNAHMVFRAYIGEFELFAGSRLIYAFRDPAVHGRLTVHDVPLGDVPGGRVYVRIPHPSGSPYFGDYPLLAAPDAAPIAIREATVAPLRDDASDLIAGAVLFILGAISLGASRVRRRADDALFWFGVFAVLYGARLMLDTLLPVMLGATYRGVQYAVAFITYVITIPGWTLARRLIGDGWKDSLRWQIAAFLVFAPIGIASDILTATPGSLEAVNNILVVIGGINVLANLIAASRRRSHELRVVLAGTLFFMAFALNNNLAALGVLPWDEADETLGFVVFVAALGYAATRSFLRAERERLGIVQELETAREIQQSILPRRMPEVSGLRFHAHYDPASSVAGDLYDFLRAGEDGVGVLVADVSGHGVPAALVASMVKIAVSSQARLAGQPAQMLAELNGTLRREVRRGFVTATYLYFDSARRTVDVANAGHPSPLLLRDGTTRELGPQGVLLGRFDTRYTSESTPLLPGDRIVAFTDGIVEARNARGEELGLERLQAFIARGGPAPALASIIAAEARRWRDDDEDADDVTLVIVDVV